MRLTDTLNARNNMYGAQEETRTLNPKDMDLNHARIPIPPHVHQNLVPQRRLELLKFGF